MKPQILSRRASAIAAALSVLLAACGGGGGGYGGTPTPPPTPPETLSAQLTPDQESAAVASGAFGRATFTLDRANYKLSATVTVDGVTPTAAHIHAGEAGTDGAVVFPMTVSADGATLASTTLSAAQLASLDAGELYVNIHSADAPSGEIRGQVGREVFSVKLSGAQEVVPVDTTATGNGRLVLNPVTRALSGEIELQGITATAAHIHTGAAGNNGGVLITLEDHGGHGHFTVPANTVLTEAQAASLRAGELYANVHSADFSGGELRGQIGQQVIFAEASGAQEVPANASTASARGFVVYNPGNRGLSGSFTLNGVAATAAHLHNADVGVNGPVVIGLAETATGSGVWVVPANTVLTAAQAAALLSGQLYFNAHSAAVPSGEVRGQINVQ
jgi:hypothetical protein